MNKNLLLCPAALAIAACLPVPEAEAAATLSSSVAMRVANDFGPEPPRDGGSDLLFSDFTASTDTVSLNKRFSFGEEGELDFNATASASTSYQQLRAGVTGSVFGDSYNSDQDAKYFDQATRETNPDGKPDYFDVDAESTFTETLQYGGSAQGYTSRYFLNLTGSVSGIGAFVLVEVDHATSGRSFDYISFETGDYNIPIVTESFVGAANQEFTIRLFTSYQVETFDGGSAELDGSSSFGNTLEFLGVEVREESTGRLLRPDEITSESGTTYAVVPEPGTAAMALIGLTLLTRRRRA